MELPETGRASCLNVPNPPTSAKPPLPRLSEDPRTGFNGIACIHQPVPSNRFRGRTGQAFFDRGLHNRLYIQKLWIDFLFSTVSKTWEGDAYSRTAGPNGICVRGSAGTSPSRETPASRWASDLKALRDKS